MIPDPTPPPAIPDFQLLRRIGGGSYGDVWLARGATGMYRAVKIVRADRFESSRPFIREWDGITRFQKCASGRPRQLALLHVGTNEAERFYYYSMELADDAERGSEIDPDHYVALTFKERLRRDGRITGAECLRLAVDLTQALAELHGLGLIHRDIKPSNLIFVNGQPKIADVGLVASVEEPLSAVGTPGYQAPEGPGSRAADLYSLGKVIYEMATGKGPDQFPLLPPGLAAWPDVNLVMELNEVITRACDFNPSARYQTAEEMLEALRHIQAGGSLKDWAETKRRLARVVRVAGWGAAAAAVVILALGVRSYLAIRELAQIKIRDERMARYVNDLELASGAIEKGTLGIARSALQRQVPKPGEADLRSFEWQVLAQEARGRGQVVYSNSVPVRDLAVGPARSRLAALLESGELLLVDPSGGSPPARLAQGVTDLAGIRPDGGGVALTRMIAGPLESIEVATGVPGPPQPVEALLVRSVPGTPFAILASGSSATNYVFQIWNHQTASEARRLETRGRFPREQFVDADVGAGGREFATVLLNRDQLDRQFRLVAWDMSRDSVRWSRTFSNNLDSPRLSEDGRHLFVVEKYSQGLVFETETGTLVAELDGHGAKITDAAFSPEGSRLATASDDQTVRLWQAPEWHPAAGGWDQLTGNELSVQRVVWSRDGQSVMTAGNDGSVRRFDLSQPAGPRTLRGLYGYNLFGNFCVSADGRLLAASLPDATAAIFQLRDFTPVARCPEVFHPLAFDAASGELVGLGRDGSLRRQATNGLPGTVIRASLWPGRDPQRIQSWAASGDGVWLAFGGLRGGVLVVNSRSGDVREFTTTDDVDVKAVAIDPAKSLVAAGEDDGTLRLWSTQTGGLLETVTAGNRVMSVALGGRTGDLAVGWHDGQVGVWSRSRKEWNFKVPGHGHPVYAVAALDDQDRLASGGEEGEVLIWDWNSGRRLARLPVLEGHAAAPYRSICALSYQPGGAGLTALTTDGRVLHWGRPDPR